MLNKVFLVGNLRCDPEIRSTSSGVPVVNLSIVTNRQDGDGNVRDNTDWHSVVCFGRQAEAAAQCLSRGQLIYIEGRIQARLCTDETRYRNEIVWENFQTLGQRQGDGGAPDDAEAPDQHRSDPEPNDDIRR